MKHFAKKLLVCGNKRKHALLFIVVFFSAIILLSDYFEFQNENDNEVFWSIIIAARNDNYGTTFKRRLQAFVNSIGYFDRKYKWKSELIICQWNPVEEEPLIEDSYSWNFNRIVRVINVPNSIHRRFENADLFVLHEYIAKNTAARRARGKWLLFTNPDDVFGKDLAKRLRQFNEWDEKCFYRVDKLDFTKPLTNDIHPSKYEKECRKTGTVLVGGRKLANNKQFWDEWDEEARLRAKQNSNVEITWPTTGSESEYFLGAPGDFFAIKAERFLELKGHPEEGKYGTMDSVIMWIAGIDGHMCQARLFSPYINCHQAHERGNNTKLPKSDFDKYKELTKNGINPQFNNDSWGLKEDTLYESVYNNGIWIKQKSVVYLQ